VIRVLIVDDHEVVRQGLRFLLEQEDGIEVVDECGDGPDALRAVTALAPAVVLLDLFLPGEDGISVLTKIKQQRPDTEVLMLTSSGEDEHLLAAIRAGALAYLPKTAAVDQVVSSVRAAARGESVLEPRIAARLVREVREVAVRRRPLDRLTPRELEVLTALARGRSNREIARELGIGEETVKAHVSSILAKLQLTDRTQAAIFGLQQRLVPLDQALDQRGDDEDRDNAQRNRMGVQTPGS
jgi:NarL family two-component system response regulator LiaR